MDSRVLCFLRARDGFAGVQHVSLPLVCTSRYCHHINYYVSQQVQPLVLDASCMLNLLKHVLASPCNSATDYHSLRLAAASLESELLHQLPCVEEGSRCILMISINGGSKNLLQKMDISAATALALKCERLRSCPNVHEQGGSTVASAKAETLSAAALSSHVRQIFLHSPL